MPWKEKTIMFQKEEFIRQIFLQNETFSSICNKFNISRTTGYQLLKKYNCEGGKGLLAPSRSPLSIPQEILRAKISK